MESEFIALDKCGEEAERLYHFLEDIRATYLYSLANQRLVEYRVPCIMENLEKFIIDRIRLDNYSYQELS